jgi:hypothetical protein
MRIIIAGSRSFDDYYYLRRKCLSAIESLCYSSKPSDYEIISGGAQGADRMGQSFANEFKIPLKIMNADWNKYGKSAGYIRNQEMSDYAKQDPDMGVLIAFWDEKSKGTKHMIDIAKKDGLESFVYIIPK